MRSTKNPTPPSGLHSSERNSMDSAVCYNFVRIGRCDDFDISNFRTPTTSVDRRSPICSLRTTKFNEGFVRLQLRIEDIQNHFVSLFCVTRFCHGDRPQIELLDGSNFDPCRSDSSAFFSRVGIRKISGVNSNSISRHLAISFIQKISDLLFGNEKNNPSFFFYNYLDSRTDINLEQNVRVLFSFFLFQLIYFLNLTRIRR